MTKVIFQCIAIGGLLAIAISAFAADAVHPPKTTSDTDESWTYQPSTSPVSNARAIAQEKAEIRAQQRMDRLSAQSWSGIYTARPAESGTPFTQPRASWWDRPHQLPNAWYEAVQRPFNIHVTDDHVAQRGYPPMVQ
jgi:hypothetical protein